MLTSEIKSKALESGYLACGIIPSSAFNEYKQYLDERVREFPESKELYDPLYILVKPPEHAKSIIVCTYRYNKYKTPDSLSKYIGKIYLMFEGDVYANNYEAKVEFEAYMQTSGINIINCYVPTRWAAARAGLGKFGRNNFIYDPKHGSYIWVQCWVTDREFEYDTLPENIYLSGCSDNCEKCVRACPTGALSGGFSMDRGKCVTQLAYAAKDVPEEKIREQMGSWLYGCDACQDVCPYNKDKFKEEEEIPQLSQLEEYLKPENILMMDDDAYIKNIYPRFCYAGKDGLWLWKCNALRAMINSGEKKYHYFIKKFYDHTDARISKVAQWGCSVLDLNLTEG